MSLKIDLASTDYQDARDAVAAFLLRELGVPLAASRPFLDACVEEYCGDRETPDLERLIFGQAVIATLGLPVAMDDAERRPLAFAARLLRGS